MPLALQSFTSTKDASVALQAHGARYLGGGTLVVRAANEGDISISSLVRVTDPVLAGIEISGAKANIGAGCTMAAISRHPGLAFLAPAARAVGGPAIRNMATIGGNLFAPAPYGDLAVALLALDATIHVDGQECPIEKFLAERETAYRGKIVTAVSFLIPPEGSFRFRKVSRVKPKGVSVLSLASVLDEKSDGTISAVRIALGCMADRPMRALAAEKALIGKRRDKDGVAQALAVVGEGTTPITDPIASAWYRTEVLPVHLGRLLLT